ncbi:MAG: aspartate aminotransferase [Bacteroidetes bacterium]|nr:aspartate aminotransferase [Bacteroidota bacterium]
MNYKRMPIEIESPEEKGYGTITHNLAESSVRDIYLKDVNVDLTDVLLFYGEHKGLLKLREAIKEDSKVLTADDVLVTSGAATALFVVATSMLSSKDHLVVIRPNYGTNLETPRALNCQMSIIDMSFENNFDIDVEAISKAIQPNTRLISVTNPHNPSGKLYDESTINALIALAEKNNCHLLVDETYRDLNFQTELKPYVAELSDKVISVSSVSKSYGAPGIRIGWIISRDKKIMHDFLAGKEQICLCNSVVDEEIAYALLNNKVEIIKNNHAHILTNFQYLKEWFAKQPYLEWVEPKAGVVCFPRLKQGYTVDAEKLYDTLYEKHGTIVGPGHWFEQDKTYMRIGFGYPGLEELKEGLANLEKCLKELATEVRP